MKFTRAAILAATASIAGASWEYSPQNIAKAMESWRSGNDAHLFKRAYGSPNSEFKYYNEKTSKFWVNGTAGAIPEVHFEVGESYSGLMPISADKDESRQLFFWFWPTAGGKETEDDIVIWLNGGPGCSSLEGFLQENGPISWKAGTYAPVPNPYSWTNLTNMVWVEQPVGTGFSQGEPNIKSEEDLAKQFLGFWKQLMDTFDGLKGKRIWVTGESYAGAYVPFITNAFYNANDTDYYNAHGLMINDPVIDDGYYLQNSVPVYPFAQHWQDMLAFDDKFMAELKQMHEHCGFNQLWDDGMTFPPKGPIMPKTQMNMTQFRKECRAFSKVAREATVKNPCWNIYKISDTCPTPYDPMGFPGSEPYLPPGAVAYFARRDVQDAIHAPHVNWTECAEINVFVGGDDQESDESEGTSVKQLPDCIAKSKRVVIANGDLDFILMTNGTLLAIQNMTWGGQQGFQQAPSKRINIEYENQGDMGVWTEERGLTWAAVKLSGHMLPGYQPGAGYKLLEYLLGRIDSLSGGGNSTATSTSSDDDDGSSKSFGPKKNSD